MILINRKDNLINILCNHNNQCQHNQFSLNNKQIPLFYYFHKIFNNRHPHHNQLVNSVKQIVLLQRKHKSLPHIRQIIILIIIIRKKIQLIKIIIVWARLFLDHKLYKWQEVVESYKIMSIDINSMDLEIIISHHLYSNHNRILVIS